MTETLEQFRARMKREISAAVSKGWAEDKRMRVQAIQAANPGMSFETAWRQADREQLHPAPEPTTIGEAAKLVHAQNPTWTFERSWNYAVAVHPEIVCARADAPRDPGTPKNPMVMQELARHKKLSDSRQSDASGEHADRLAKIRKLMQENGWDFNRAFTQVCDEENAAKKAVPARYTTPIPFGTSILVTAQSAVQFDGLPTTIQYMPAGRSTITPTVNGRPKEISVNVTPTTAAALQADLSRLLSGNVRPYVDFDHSGGAAAALPRRFFWKEGEGVMMELDWTGAGKTAIGDRNYSYLSPTFMLSSADGAINLPASGAIASLVNDPAFRTIRRIHV
jgi:hypothetical protein